MTLSRVFLDDDAPTSGFPYELPAIRALPLEITGSATVWSARTARARARSSRRSPWPLASIPKGGSGQVRFETAPTHSHLGDHLELLWSQRLEPGWFLRAESFYNVATYRERNPGPGFERSYHAMSHGESFLTVARDWFAALAAALISVGGSFTPVKICGTRNGMPVHAVSVNLVDTDDSRGLD